MSNRSLVCVIRPEARWSKAGGNEVGKWILTSGQDRREWSGHRWWVVRDTRVYLAHSWHMAVRIKETLWATIYNTVIFCGFLTLHLLKVSTRIISFPLFSYTQVRDWNAWRRLYTLSEIHWRLLCIWTQVDCPLTLWTLVVCCCRDDVSTEGCCVQMNRRTLCQFRNGSIFRV